jgi:hypothetical protein
VIEFLNLANVNRLLQLLLGVETRKTSRSQFICLNSLSDIYGSDRKE